ncbi:MAG: periplasmic binding protein/LacI transcriptional regulator [Thermomicrobiales bacterium]|nr:periplasmic binding protein/LacI transcriptional regulator [Thermomicrobiales bacterium]
MMTVRHWLLVAPLVLTLALAGAPTAARQSTPTGEVASGTCIPEGGIPQQDSYLIGMSQANEGEPWRQAMNDQIAAAAAMHPELEVVFADAAQTNAKQVADVENFLQQGIDLLIISPNEAAPLTDVVAEVCAEGVPVIVLDRKVNGDQFTMWIGANNEEIGQRAGEYAANYCTEQTLDPCNIIEIRGLEGSTPAKERGDGFRTGIAVNPSAIIIAQQNADWLREKAIPVSQAMFQANPDINVVYTHNDPMTEAAIISAQNAGLNLDEILFIGIDALPTPDGGIRSVIDGRIDVTYVYPTGGAEAIDYAVQILEQGVTPPAEVVLETEEVVPENAQQLLDKYTGGGTAATPAA